MSTRVQFAIAATCVLLLLPACGGRFVSPAEAFGGVRGEAFDLEEIPADRAMVYIYRPRALVGGGVNFDVRVGDRRIVRSRTAATSPTLRKRVRPSSGRGP